MPINLLVADAQRIFREGLRCLCSHREDIEVVGEAQDGIEAVRQTEQLKPHVVLMDIALPRLNGVEYIRQIVAKGISTRVLSLSMHSNRGIVIEALRSDASGYLLKDCDSEELFDAIVAIADGQFYVSPSITHILLKEVKAGKSRGKESGAERQGTSGASAVGQGLYIASDCRPAAHKSEDRREPQSTNHEEAGSAQCCGTNQVCPPRRPDFSRRMTNPGSEGLTHRCLTVKERMANVLGSKEQTTILLADAQKIFREGLLSLLQQKREMRVIGKADNGKSMLSLSQKLKPDLVITDIALPILNGIEATRKIIRGGPHRLDHLAAFLRWTPQFLLPPVREILRGGEPEGKVPLRMFFQASVHLLRRRPSVRRVRSLAVV